MNPVVRIESVVKRFRHITAVDNVSLEVGDGEFVALLGPSGCGKTTLLRMLGGFDYPDEGRIFIDGKDMSGEPPNKRPVNMLFQSYAVFPHMTVENNVGYGLRVVGTDKHNTKRRVDEALALVRMSEYAKRMPDKLSGGQRQRVALARALVKKPRVLLLDEPLSALDAKLREAMQAELVNLQHAVGITFIVVTHDQDEALSMAGRIAVMNNGKFQQITTPQNLYEHPNSRFVADFIGRMNLLPCIAVNADNTTCKIKHPTLGELTVRHELPTPPAAGAKLYYGIRPEKLCFAADASNEPNTLSYPATVQSSSYHGDETLLRCAVGEDTTLLCVNTNTDRMAAHRDMAGVLGRLFWWEEDAILLAD